MKRNITACMLIVVCLVVTLLVSYHQVHAQGYSTVPISIKHNPGSKGIASHDYFSPTFPTCTSEMTIILKLKNTTNHTVYMSLYNYDGSYIGPATVAKGKTFQEALVYKQNKDLHFEIQVWTVEKVLSRAFIDLC